MVGWSRAWTLPYRGLGPSSSSFSRLPIARGSSQGGTEPRAVPLSYKLLDGEAASPPLVFLHGLFGSKANFGSIPKTLAQQTGRRVLTVDARNHGESPHSPDISYKAMSQDLQDLLLQLGLVPCVLIGHSMGGRTAMLLALQRPELVERLIVVDISPVETTITSKFPSYVTAMRAVDMANEVSLSAARKLADERLRSVIQSTVMRQYLLTNVVEVDGRFVWRLNLDALDKHLNKMFYFPAQEETYSGPTLFLRGGNSQFLLPSHYPVIRRLFPRAQILTVPNASHWIHSDCPQDFMAAVRGFLA